MRGERGVGMTASCAGGAVLGLTVYRSLSLLISMGGGGGRGFNLCVGMMGDGLAVLLQFLGAVVALLR